MSQPRVPMRQPKKVKCSRKNCEGPVYADYCHDPKHFTAAVFKKMSDRAVTAEVQVMRMEMLLRAIKIGFADIQKRINEFKP